MSCVPACDFVVHRSKVAKIAGQFEFEPAPPILSGSQYHRLKNRNTLTSYRQLTGTIGLKS